MFPDFPQNEPLCLTNFRKICSIPHGSFHEAALIDYLEEFGKNLGCETFRDASDNLIIKKAATPGYEDRPAVILQGHTDMVCVAEPGLDFDFLTQPLKLIEKDGILKADGTTLGADDGTAVAHMMTLLMEDDYVHPALECLFTTKEEVGLLGALELDASPLTGKNLIAMDSGYETDDVTTVSCAGAWIMDLKRKSEWELFAGHPLELTICGLSGGHSALAIDKERGNAIKLMARILHDIGKEVSFHIVSISGGVKMNSIPTDATCIIALDTPENLAKAAELASALGTAITSELSGSDAGFRLSCSPYDSDAPARMLTAWATHDLIDLLFLMPNGVRSMSMDFPGLVAASSNIGVLRVTDEEITISLCIRAAEDSLRDLIGHEIQDLCAIFSFEIVEGSRFSGWKYDPHSALRAMTQEIYEEMTGKPMRIQAMHGGMEIGVFKSLMPWLDIVSVAPVAANPHSPAEYMEIDSYVRIYELLKRLLTRLAR